MDALRQLRGPLELADERQDEDEVREVVAGGHLPDPDEVALGRVGADPAERDAIHHEDPEGPLVDRPEARAPHPGGIEPGQDEEDGDRGDHRHDTAQLVRDRTQDRVEGQEVPFRHDMRRRLQRVRLLVVDHLAQHVRHVEGEHEQDEQHHPDPERVLDRVVGVEGDGVLGALDIDAERVVRLAVVQRPEMQEDHADEHEGQQIVQRVEAVERRVVDREAAPQPGDDRLADPRDRRGHVGDHRRRPEAHLPPRQNVAHEGRRHHEQQDDDAHPPEDLARRLVGAVVEAAEEVDVDHREEHRGAVRVEVAHQPAPLDVAHDVLDGVEGEVAMGRVVHRQHHAGHDLQHQHDPGEGAEVPPVVEVTRRRVVDEVLVGPAEDRQAVLDPLGNAVLRYGCRHPARSPNRSEPGCRRGTRRSAR